METVEQRIARVTSIALCQFRGVKEAEFQKHESIMMMSRPGSDDYYIAVDKMLRAAEDCHAAHAALAVDCKNPCDVWEPEMVEACRSRLGDKAADAYERADDAIQDAALRRFHHDAFGDAT